MKNTIAESFPRFIENLRNLFESIATNDEAERYLVIDQLVES